ncbi:MAG TPA: 4-(cytidine 5'-diphospho)-2-C-methyl-D-erythritol kinase [Fibrobacteria bacterium]|nr:4-(cytidine 5'-diphospho)-2-C-methyl-D-erythritol kinase [Fibrobacteria bacterium]
MTAPLLLSLPCPAKINLYLEIRGKRDDGFHELGTLFQAVEAGDTLSAEPWDTITLHGADGLTDTPEDNLIVKAARLLQARHPERVPRHAGIRFMLEKRLPSGAGLGGGSSDAAAALRLTNAIWNVNLPSSALIALGAELGSDVPFFLAPTPTAYGEGRGERLEPAPAPPDFHVVIATPHCRVETPWAYREAERYRQDMLGGEFGTTWREFRRAYATQAGRRAFYTSLRNDFEAPVMAGFPEIRAVRDALNEHAPVKTMLSGSGASVFALFDEARTAQTAAEALAPRCRFAVKTSFVPPPPVPRT